VISPVIATSARTGAPEQQRRQRRDHRDAGRRAVLRDGAGGEVQVQVALANSLAGRAERSAWRAAS
jgi:hypothetical protein